jgi:hypothetical protein
MCKGAVPSFLIACDAYGGTCITTAVAPSKLRYSTGVPVPLSQCKDHRSTDVTSRTSCRAMWKWLPRTCPGWSVLRCASRTAKPSSKEPVGAEKLLPRSSPESLITVIFSSPSVTPLPIDSLPSRSFAAGLPYKDRRRCATVRSNLLAGRLGERATWRSGCLQVRRATGSIGPCPKRSRPARVHHEGFAVEQDPGSFLAARRAVAHRDGQAAVPPGPQPDRGPRRTQETETFRPEKPT